ncbi:MAG: hypothetical protein A2W17_04495 [Planctomycetes bacterium RBG_16_41_13]|nr:MAG: hypothetical protein A2W17_04495 [Planctomycetes bacterium RBG_16_41_13]
MQTINFSYNGNNKLNCKYFTTLRLSSRLSIGEIVWVTVNNVFLKECKVVQIKSFLMEQLDLQTCGLDTGYSVEDTKNILKKTYSKANWQTQKIYLYILKTQ